MKAVNLADKLATFTEHYQPRTVGEFNGHDLPNFAKSTRATIIPVLRS